MSRTRQTAIRLTRLFGPGLLAWSLLGGQGALAQQDDIDGVSLPVVQAIPGGKGMKLNDALGMLARNPQDVNALIGAGRASMEIGDLDAAVGFYQRADRLSPGNARVKAGLAGAYALSQDPFTAIPLFIEAEKAGLIDPALQADRGLAYDLVGDNASAQRYYRSALSNAPNDETFRRLALSQAIMGDRRGMEVTLSPLLQRQDKAAWRTRAFGLAILGQKEEAVSIAQANLPRDLAEAMANYLNYMPRLTPAQQAAAANLGHFPRASEIGIDDPRVSVFRPKPVVLAAASVPAVSPGVKKGKDKGAKDKGVRGDGAAVKPPVQVAIAPSPPPATREVTRAPVTLALNTSPPAPVPAPPPVIVSLPTPTPAPPPPAPVVVKIDPPAAAPRVLAVPPSSVPAPSNPGFASLDGAAAPVAPGFDLKPSAPAVTPPPPPPAPPVPPKPRSLSDVFADLTPPSREAEPKAGAVDIRRIGPVRPAIDKTAKDARSALAEDCAPQLAAASKSAKGTKGSKSVQVARGGKGATTSTAKIACPVNSKDTKGKSPAASQPSRIWVQIATGRDKSALAFDWRRMVKEEPEILGKYRAATSAFGQSNRLLAGPFESEGAASALVTKLKRAGIGGAFVWTSPAGQVVDPLGGK